MKKKKIESNFLRGMEEAYAHSKGCKKLSESTKILPAPAPDWDAGSIQRLRKDYGFSQVEFARVLNIKTPTIRSWEQGQKIPSGSASRLLEILMKDRSIVKKLAKAS